MSDTTPFGKSVWAMVSKAGYIGRRQGVDGVAMASSGETRNGVPFKRAEHRALGQVESTVEVNQWFLFRRSRGEVGLVPFLEYA